MKIALGQINPTVGDFSGNSAKIIEFARRAQNAGAGLILFPELAVCGYPPRDLVERAWFVERNRITVERIAAETTGIAVICGMVTPAHAESGKSVMNSAALLRNGRVEFVQSKMLLPTYDVFDEMRNFAPARSQQLFSFCARGNAYFWIGSDFKKSQQADSDVYALNNGFVSITPLTLDSTAVVEEGTLQKWLKALDAARVR